MEDLSPEFADLSLEDKEALWQKAKQLVKSQQHFSI